MSTLVRVWDGFQEEVASGFVDWTVAPNGGCGFVAPLDDPVANLLFGSPEGNLRLTVYSTWELLWSVDKVRLLWGEYHVHCKPFIDVLRASLVSDEYLVHVWLEAERRFQESA